MTPAMAILMLDDDHAKQTCLGCSAILAEQGMLEVWKELPLSDMQPEFSIIFYSIAPGFTLADCQAAVRARHIGPPSPWGS